MSSVLSEETRLRDEICDVGLSLFERGFTVGSTGNISARLSDGTILCTPTNASLGRLDPASLAVLTPDGAPLRGDKPTKEAFLHRCMYCSRPTDGAVVHLHSTYCVAVSTLEDVDREDVLPPLTAYYVMRVGALPLVPYFPPGDEALAIAVGDKAKASHAVLLANHGPVVSGKTLRDAQYAIEELEETAKLFLLLRGQKTRPLTTEEVRDLKERS